MIPLDVILVGAVFFHRCFLQLFQEQLGEVHTLVDQMQNCNDFAINFWCCTSTLTGVRIQAAVWGVREACKHA